VELPSGLLEQLGNTDILVLYDGAHEMPVEADSVARQEVEANLLAPVRKTVYTIVLLSHELKGIFTPLQTSGRPLPQSNLDSLLPTSSSIVQQGSFSKHIPPGVQLSPVPPATENEEEHEDTHLHQELERVRAKKLRLQSCSN
jgi:hypothetical protein